MHGGGPDSEVDLAVAKARYRSGDVGRINAEYAEDGRSKFVFFAGLCAVLTGMLAFADTIFLWAFFPLLALVVVLVALPIRRRMRRNKLMDAEIVAQRYNEEER